MPKTPMDISLPTAIGLAFGPILALSGGASFLWATSVEALAELRALYVAIGGCAILLSVASLRWQRLRMLMCFANVLLLSLTVYAAGTRSGAASAVSLLDRPSALVAIVGGAWACVAAFSAPRTERRH